MFMSLVTVPVKRLYALIIRYLKFTFANKYHSKTQLKDIHWAHLRYISINAVFGILTG